MTSLGLIADDLTGALDSAAAFTRVMGPVRVAWDAQHAENIGSLAVSTGTREAAADEAAARVAAFASVLTPRKGRLCLFKVDSLLRGHAGRELLSVLAVQDFAHVVIAPAIPFQRRITLAGRQTVNNAPTGEDIVATLRSAGRRIAICEAGAEAPAGLSFWNTGTDADLDAVVAAGRRLSGPVLWVGAAGLADALARAIGAPLRAPQGLVGPLLGLIGTDHPVMQGQIAACAELHVELGADIGAAEQAVHRLFAGNRAAFITCALPPDIGRAAAEHAIATRFAALCRRIDWPGALFVSGGETLAELCAGLGVTTLTVTGEFESGAPMSRLNGGMWDGLDLISKSGAFGTPDFLARLVSSLDRSVKVTPT